MHIVPIFSEGKDEEDSADKTENTSGVTSASLASDHSKTHPSIAESSEENHGENLSDVTDAVQKTDELSVETIQNSSEDRPAPSLPLTLADDSTVNSFRMLSSNPKHLIRFGLLEEDNHSCNAVTGPITRATQDVVETSCKLVEHPQNSGVQILSPVTITDRPFAAVSANNVLSTDGMEEMTAYSCTWTNASDPSESSDVEDERTINEDEIIYVSTGDFGLHRSFQ